MGITSIWHWLLVLVVILIIFGAGKLPKVMGDVAKGIKNFKSGMSDEPEDDKTLPHHRQAPGVDPVAGSAARKDEAADGRGYRG